MLSLTPELLVEDLHKTINWYQTILGFEMMFVAPETGSPTFARIKRGSVEIMLYHRSEFAKEIQTFSTIPPGGSFALYLEIENLANEWIKIKDVATIIQTLHKTPYSSIEFTIQDCNGYHLIFGEQAR